MHSEFHKSVATPFKHSGMTTRVSIVPSKPLFGSINLNYQMVPTAYPQLLNSGFLHLTSLSLSLSRTFDGHAAGFPKCSYPPKESWDIGCIDLHCHDTHHATGDDVASHQQYLWGGISNSGYCLVFVS